MNFQFGLPVDNNSYQDALKLRSDLERELEHAQTRLRVIKEQLRLVEELIRSFERLSQNGIQERSSAELQPSETSPPRVRERNTVPPLELADMAYEILKERGQPMTRGQLVEAIEARGVPLAGGDKAKNLGTILWRFRDRFDNIPRLGYWPKDLPRIGHDPNNGSNE